MADEPLAPYVSEGVDAGEELRALGYDVARYFVIYLQTIVSRQRSYRHDRPFLTFGNAGIAVFKAEYRACFIIYVVGEEADGGLMVTLIQAGRMAMFASDPSIPEAWDEHALRAVAAFVRPRLEDFFA